MDTTNACQLVYSPRARFHSIVFILAVAKLVGSICRFIVGLVSCALDNRLVAVAVQAGLLILEEPVPRHERDNGSAPDARRDDHADAKDVALSFSEIGRLVGGKHDLLCRRFNGTAKTCLVVALCADKGKQGPRTYIITSQRLTNSLFALSASWK